MSRSLTRSSKENSDDDNIWISRHEDGDEIALYFESEVIPETYNLLGLYWLTGFRGDQPTPRDVLGIPSSPDGLEDVSLDSDYGINSMREVRISYDEISDDGGGTVYYFSDDTPDNSLRTSARVLLPNNQWSIWARVDTGYSITADKYVFNVGRATLGLLGVDNTANAINSFQFRIHNGIGWSFPSATIEAAVPPA